MLRHLLCLQVLVKCQEVYCRKTSPLPLGIHTTAGNKLVITQIAEEGLRDTNVPYAPAAVLPGPADGANEDIYREPVIVQTPSPCLLQSYEDVGQAAFGDKGRAFITAVLYTELIGTCALFFILEVSAASAGHLPWLMWLQICACACLWLLCAAQSVLYVSIVRFAVHL